MLVCGVGFEVSSSKFQIKTDGDVVVRKVDAVAGTIGGFSITNSAISSSSTPKRGLILKPGGRQKLVLEPQDEPARGRQKKVLDQMSAAIA